MKKSTGGEVCAVTLLVSGFHFFSVQSFVSYEIVFFLQTNLQREAFQLEMCVSIFINLINGCTIKILVTEVLALAKTS